jgi:hypothetical protein
MNSINAEPHALNHLTQTSSGRTLLSRRGIAALVTSFAAVGLGSASPRMAQADGVLCSNGEQNLRDAISNPGDTVELDRNCIYTLTKAGEQDPTQGDSGLVITKKLTINGHGATITRLSSAPPFRIFLVKEVGDLTLDNVTVVNGNAVSQDFKRGRGGGIANLGNLKVKNNSVLSHNNADFGGGAISNGDASEAQNPVTGAVLTLDSSTISGNTTGSDGGGIANGAGNTMTLNNCTISSNTGGPVSGGGGIASQGTATLNNCTVSLNTASNGGGIINVGILNLNGSRVTGNSAVGMVSASSGFGGGIFNLTQGKQQGVVTANKDNNNNNNLIAFNSATNDGGGIVNTANATTTLNNSAVSRNYTASEGGGIANGGTMTLTFSDVTANNAVQDGGGIVNKLGQAQITLNHGHVTDNGTLGQCGGIFNQPGDGDMVTLNNSQVSNNDPDSPGANCPPPQVARLPQQPRQ